MNRYCRVMGCPHCNEKDEEMSSYFILLMQDWWGQIHQWTRMVVPGWEAGESQSFEMGSLEENKPLFWLSQRKCFGGQHQRTFMGHELTWSWLGLSLEHWVCLAQKRIFPRTKVCNHLMGRDTETRKRFHSALFHSAGYWHDFSQSLSIKRSTCIIATSQGEHTEIWQL